MKFAQLRRSSARPGRAPSRRISPLPPGSLLLGFCMLAAAALPTAVHAQLTMPGSVGSISDPALAGYGGGGAGGAGAGAATASNPYTSAIFTGYYQRASKDVPFKVPGFGLASDAVVGSAFLQAPGYEGLNLAESEVGLYGNIDPWWYGSLVLAFEPTTGVEVEEAFLQSLALPYGFVAKAGRFHSSIGYQNVFHRHADDFIDTPLVYTAFLDGQLDDDGVQLRWLAPINVLLQIGAEFFNGGGQTQGFPANSGHIGSPADNNKGNGTNTQFINLADDVGDGGSYLLGISHVDTTAVARPTAPDALGRTLSFTGANTVNILSGVYKWSPLGNTKYTQLKVQAEYFNGDETGTYTVLGSNSAPTGTINALGNNHITRSGWYAQAVLKFEERWKIGARYSEVETDRLRDAVHAAGTDLDSYGHVPNIVSGMVEFWPSEFSQFRLQYSRDDTLSHVQGGSVDRYYLEYIITLGAHAAHVY